MKSKYGKREKGERASSPCRRYGADVSRKFCSTMTAYGGASSARMSAKGKTAERGALATKDAAKAMGVSRPRFVALVSWLNFVVEKKKLARGGSAEKYYAQQDVGLLCLLRERCARDGGRAVLNRLLVIQK